MKLDFRAQGLCSKAKGVTLGPSPGSPLNDHRHTPPEKFLAELPLQRLDPASLFFIVEIDGERVHPFIGTKANGIKLFPKLFGESRFSGARQTANDDKLWAICVH